jgi:hypothetical protein
LEILSWYDYSYLPTFALIIISNFGTNLVNTVFIVTSIVFAIVIWIYLPETTGLTLEEIEGLFDERAKISVARAVDMSDLENGKENSSDGNVIDRGLGEGKAKANLE